MNQPDYGPPSDSGPWPYESPNPVPGYPDPDDRTEPYQELHHEGAVPGDPGPWGILQDQAVPADWPGYGAYTPELEDQSPWDPPGPALYAPHPYGGRQHHTSVHPIVIAALLLAAFTAGAGVVLLRNETIRLSPTGNPRSTATSGMDASAGTGHARNGRLRPAATEPPAITKAEAEYVVSRYWQVNNEANESYSDSLLATIESGSSYTMDAGSYRFALGSTDRTPYVAFKLTDTRYYIPRLPRASYPRWFVVRGSYVTLAGKNLGSAYIVFAQDSPGATWKDVTEPDILPGRALPQIATGSGGYAESVSADDAGLSVAPDKIGQVTATWLDQVAVDSSDTAVLRDSGNLTDLKDEVFWRSRKVRRSRKGGARPDVADTHSVPADPVFALKTTDGGALVFCTVAAHLVLTPPAGDTISALTIPGYYPPSSSAGLTSAAVGYVEQFATYVPPAGHSGRQIVADIASIASRG